MNLKVIQNKKFRKSNILGHTVFIFINGLLDSVQSSLKHYNSHTIKVWNSKYKLFDMLDDLKISLSQKEKNFHILALKRVSHKNYCFVDNENIYVLGRSYGFASNMAYDFSKRAKQVIVGLGIHVNKSRWKKYRNKFIFAFYVSDNHQKPLTMGTKNVKGLKDILPDINCLNTALKSNVSQKELEDLWQIDRADKFVPQLEKLFNIRLIYDERVIEQEFDCIKDKEWYGIYKYKNE